MFDFSFARTLTILTESRGHTMKILFILNDAPYGSERTYNALRLVMALQKEQPQTEIHIF